MAILTQKEELHRRFWVSTYLDPFKGGLQASATVEIRYYATILYLPRYKVLGVPRLFVSAVPARDSLTLQALR